MNRLLATSLGTIAVVYLAGCGPHIHTLAPGSADAVLAGHLVHGGSTESNLLVVEVGGKHFEGGFSVETTQNWTELRERYRSNSRHWDRIVSGLDRDHEVKMARAELRSADSDSLVCKLVWRVGTNPAGVCKRGSDDTAYPVRFE